MKRVALALLSLSIPLVAGAASDPSIIKTSQLICGAVSCRFYSLEKASVSGTVVRISWCDAKGANGDQTAPCTIDIRRDITHGPIPQAIKQFDQFVSEDDGD
jgi:hypothetical protein